MSNPEAWVDGWGFLSGIGPADPANAAIPLPESVEDQTRAIFANLERKLRARELTRRDVMCVRIHLVEFKRFYERMNRVYTEYFAGNAAPSVSCIGVSALVRGALVEMDFVVRDARR